MEAVVLNQGKMVFMERLWAAWALALSLGLCALSAQVIEFESNGFKYQTLTRSGVTVMFAQMPSHIHEYTILQVAVSNGSPGPYVIRPDDFSYEHPDGRSIRAVPAQTVIAMLMQKGMIGLTNRSPRSCHKGVPVNRVTPAAARPKCSSR